MTSLSAITALKALDGLTRRSVVTAENIANAGTPGFAPLRVSFEKALAAAAASGDPEAVRAVEPSVNANPGADLRVDLEMATASSTQLRYAGLIEMLNRQFQLQALAIKGSL